MHLAIDDNIGNDRTIVIVKVAGDHYDIISAFATVMDKGDIEAAEDFTQQGQCNVSLLPLRVPNDDDISTQTKQLRVPQPQQRQKESAAILIERNY